MKTIPVDQSLIKSDILRNFIHEMERRGAFICGGYARWLTGINPSILPMDIDFYPTCKEASDYTLQFLKNHPKISGFNVTKKSDYLPFTVISGGLALEQNFTQKIQVIESNELPVNVISKFDLTVCRAFVSSNIVTVMDQFFEDEKARILRVVYVDKDRIDRISQNGNLYPFFNRFAKYMNNGYIPDVGTFMTLISACEKEYQEDFLRDTLIYLALMKKDSAKDKERFDLIDDTYKKLHFLKMMKCGTEAENNIAIFP